MAIQCEYWKSCQPLPMWFEQTCTLKQILSNPSKIVIISHWRPHLARTGMQEVAGDNRLTGGFVINKAYF